MPLAEADRGGKRGTWPRRAGPPATATKQDDAGVGQAAQGGWADTVGRHGGHAGTFAFAPCGLRQPLTCPPARAALVSSPRPR